MDCSSRAAGPFFVKAQRNCSCFAQAPQPAPPCLFGDMRPAKLLAIISACRRAGVTHIIEQGRYGGLSAYIYSLHGFTVTSVELLPLSEVSTALTSLAPTVRQVDGDGRRAVLDLVARAKAGDRLAVIFDGEKRRTAYETFMRIKAHIALAVFDDTNLDDGAFPRMLRERGEDAWHTWDCAFMRQYNDAAPLAALAAKLRAATSSGLHNSAADSLMRERIIKQGLATRDGSLIFHGGVHAASRTHAVFSQQQPPTVSQTCCPSRVAAGMEDLSRFHSTIVRGGTWR